MVCRPFFEVSTLSAGIQKATQRSVNKRLVCHFERGEQRPQSEIWYRGRIADTHLISSHLIPSHPISSHPISSHHSGQNNTNKPANEPLKTQRQSCNTKKSRSCRAGFIFSVAERLEAVYARNTEVAEAILIEAGYTTTLPVCNMGTDVRRPVNRKTQRYVIELDT